MPLRPSLLTPARRVFPVTLSGHEITDLVRANRLAGDGRYGDRSTGIWPSATNLITNGGGESNATGHTASGATVTRTTAQAKFGAASINVVTDNAGANEGAYHGFTGAAATQYSVSAWVRGDGGGTVRIALSDSVSGKQASSAVTLTTDWQRLTRTATTGAASNTFRVYVETDSQQALTFQYDGLQVETGEIATPYVETNGGTAARTAARVRVPSWLVGTDQGWFALRARLGWPANNSPNAATTPFFFGDDANNRLFLFNNNGVSWTLRRTAAGTSTNDAANTSVATTAGSTITLVCTWTPANVAVSVDGGAFTSAANTNIPTLTATLLELGSSEDITINRHLSAEAFWYAFGRGQLTAAGAAAIHALGNTPPRLAQLPGNPTGVWPYR